MRIVGGQFGGLSLKSPPGQNTRPTSDRVRESIFNILFHRYGTEFVHTADFFGGTGALGLEAISRGLQTCIFFESDKNALKCLDQNIQKCGLSSASTLIVRDAEPFAWRKVLKESSSFVPLDLVFSDPPYNKNWVAKLATSVLDHPSSGAFFKENCIWVSEVADDDKLPEFQSWKLLEEREFGDTKVLFYQRKANAV